MNRSVHDCSHRHFCNLLHGEPIIYWIFVRAKGPGISIMNRTTSIALIFSLLILGASAWSYGHFGHHGDEEDDDDEEGDHDHHHHGHGHHHFPSNLDHHDSHEADHDDEYHRDDGRHEKEGTAKDKVIVTTNAQINAQVTGNDQNSESHAHSENHEAEHHSHDEHDHDDGHGELDSTHHHRDDHDDEDYDDDD